jgi:hypothetical protein
VLIGVHYTGGTSKPPKNNNRATRHFMLIVGFGADNLNEYFRFYDAGRQIAQETGATSPNNRLYINHETGSIQGNYNNRTYTLTETVKY